MCAKFLVPLPFERQAVGSVLVSCWRSKNLKDEYRHVNIGKTCANISDSPLWRLSDAVVITYTSPVITAVAAALLLGEAWGKLDALGSVLCMLGVMLISDPACNVSGQ